jgi:4-hydroxybenzoate polyprenyltransferase
MASTMLRLLHCFWPAVLGWSLVRVLGHTFGSTPSDAGLVVLVTGIVAAYSIDRTRERTRTHANVRWRRSLLTIGVGAALVCGTFALRLPSDALVTATALAAVVLSYPRLKRHLPTKLLLLPSVWLLAVVVLPFAGNSGIAWQHLQHPVVPVVFLQLAAGCFLCDLKDHRTDADAAVPSLPVLVGSRWTTRIVAMIASATVPWALMLGERELAIGGALLLAAATRPDFVARDVQGPLLVDVLLSVPGLLVALRD